MTNGPLPSGATFTKDNANHPTGTFCWTPPWYGGPGVYSFIVNLLDNNSCGALPNEFTFYINVICPSCDMSVFYENRTPSNNPLPSETKVGNSIVAGYDVDNNQPNGPVETGNQPILFQAGNLIRLEPGFHAGPGFHAVIDPSTCTGNCDCCENWGGFTFDYIPNVFTPDGDGVGDIWYLPDTYHPFCAFNATGFTLIIKNSWGSTVRNVSWNSSSCCPFRSPGPGNPILYSSIYWDGTNDYTGNMEDDGDYKYVIEFTGCNNSESYNGTIQLLTIPFKSLSSSEDSLTSDSENRSSALFFSPRQRKSATQVGPNQYIQVYPNPTSDFFNVQVPEPLASEGYVMEIFNFLGERIIRTNNIGYICSMDFSFYANGIYSIRISGEDFYYETNIVKQ